MKIVSIAATVLLIGVVNRGVGDEPVRPVCVINMQTESPSSGWLLVCIEGKPYFVGGRKRHADEKLIPRPWKSREECRFFELTSKEGATTIKNLGAVESSEDGLAYVPKRDVEQPQTGFLTVDYSANPPSLKLAKEVGKLATWKILRAEKTDDRFRYIGAVDDAGKSAWLSKDERPVAVVPLGREGKFVVDYRRAVLSHDTKPVFIVNVGNEER